MRDLRHGELVERVCTGALEVLAGVWFFAFGATIGSFLNVVAYRTPRGASLIWSSSRCPHCGTRIRPWDNVPLLSWLLLRGRCRTCRLPISPRYPLVELVSALMFLSLAHVELFAVGANLPGPRPNPTAGVVRSVLDGQWDLLLVYGYHGFLLSALLSFALIQFDGHVLPKGGPVLTFAVGAAPLLLWPDQLHPVRWLALAPAWLDALPLAAGIASGGVGLAGGATLGAAVSAALSFGRPNGPRTDAPQPQTALGLGLVGLYLGWQAAVSVGAAAAVGLLAAVLCRPWPRLAKPTLGCLFVAAFAHICLWRLLCRLPWWPGPGSSPTAMAIACLAIVGVSLATARISPARPC